MGSVIVSEYKLKQERTNNYKLNRKLQENIFYNKNVLIMKIIHLTNKKQRRTNNCELNKKKRYRRTTEDGLNI